MEQKLQEEKIRKEESNERIAEVYGTDKLSKQRRTTARLKYAVLKPSQFDDHEVIALIESVPTYNREPRFNDELKRISEHNSGVGGFGGESSQRGGDTISFGDFM